MIYALVVMSLVMPILVIGAFIIGYNINAPRKIMKPKPKKKKEMTEDEKMLERIDKARI